MRRPEARRAAIGLPESTPRTQGVPVIAATWIVNCHGLTPVGVLPAGMANRTFAIGDVHGDLEALLRLLGRLPELDPGDTLVFLGDYVDRGPDSAGVVDVVSDKIHRDTPARVVALRGNHEDAWLKVIDAGLPEFVLPPGNGCLACLRSYVPGEQVDEDLLLSGGFFPAEVVEWMRGLPHWYEDAHAIYVHAGIPMQDGRWPHPSEVRDPGLLLWTRSREFIRDYDGKTVIVGHTVTRSLPPALSAYTPDDVEDLYWAGRSTYCLDTGAGKGGFLTALELPSFLVYESRA